MDYVKTMRQSGKYADSMFGTWIQEKAPEPTPQQDLRQVLNNPGELQKMFAEFLGNQMAKNKNANTKRGQNEGNASRGGKRGRRGK